MRICGIDNGLKGAIVLIEDGKLIEKSVMPLKESENGKKSYDPAKLVTLISSMKPDFTFIERATAMPKQGCVSMFNFGKVYGMTIGILEAMRLTYYIVQPKTWQKAIFEGLKITDTKDCGYQVCQKEFPNESWLATPRCKKFHNGLTDAACIALYGYKIKGLNSNG